MAAAFDGARLVRGLTCERRASVARRFEHAELG